MSTDKVMNQLTCFEVNGTEIGPIGAQSVLPDVTNFTVRFNLFPFHNFIWAPAMNVSCGYS